MSDIMKQADTLYKVGKFSQAESKYLALLKENNDNIEVLTRLGNIALLKNRPEQSIDLYMQARNETGWLSGKWPFSAQLDYRIGSAFYRMDNFRQAAHWYAKATGPLPVGPFKELSALHKHSAAMGDDTAYEISGPGEFAINFIATDPLPFVEVMINDQGPFSFFIDTGGAEIILATSLAKRMNIETVAEIASKGFAGGKKGKVGFGRFDKLQLGEIAVKNLPAHILDLAEISQGLKRPTHGVIGTRLLMQFYSTIDYVNSRLILRRINERNRGELNKLANQSKTIPFWLADSHYMLVTGRLNDLESSLFFVDTGLAGKGFNTSGTMLEKAGVEIDWSKASRGVGGGGEIEVVDVNIKRVSIGEGDNEVIKHDLSGTANREVPAILSGEFGFKVTGIISHSFFRDATLTFDFEKMQLLIEE